MSVELRMVELIYNSYTWEAEEGGLKVQGKLGLQTKTPSQPPQKDACHKFYKCTVYFIGSITPT
jgi:hypothetical protein